MITFPQNLRRRIHPPHSRPRSIRRGSLLVEATVAVVVTGFLLAGVSMMMVVVSRHTQASREKLIAANEMANVMEAWMTKPWKTIVADPSVTEVPTTEQSEEFRRAFPETTLRVDVLPVQDDERCRKIRVSLDMKAANDRNTIPFQLTAWRYQPVSTTEETKP